MSRRWATRRRSRLASSAAQFATMVSDCQMAALVSAESCMWLNSFHPWISGSG